ncbi:malate dehydrogenase [Leptolyngbya sp. Heron Island J]|uniref:malate dehydrogenase n=1 Tax=Leptolyngbya sp. Heron Island J TaxID=1385935 RepID=UPI0003B9E99C|nr:malate dehydrogenase [Leptolyngbya sp. Heron Island J]ESA36703.1 malate dehydrogenase [Leptolyngbya sp. Heron Island J]
MVVASPSLQTAVINKAAISIPKITVIGAGNVGASLARCLLSQNLGHVVLLDIIEGRPQGLALDMAEAQPLEGYSYNITGTNNYQDTAGSQVIVITAGLPRKPGMSRDDLLKVNGSIILDVMAKALPHSPNAYFILVTNPLDVMTYLAWRSSGLPHSRVLGQAGVLDSARFRTFIAQALKVPPQDVATMVLGGHGDLMVPLISYTTVNGIPLTELLPAAEIEQLVERTRQGGAEIVNYLKTGGAFYAPAAATASMVAAILQNQSSILPVSAYLDGQYGLKDIYLGVPCRLNSKGVASVVELSITANEQQGLQTSADSVRKTLDKALPMFSV